MADVIAIKNATDRVITLMLLVMRSQIFIDGNKRTATILANKEMISNGAGVISIPEELIEEFYSLLISYYESNCMKEIKNFIYNKCIDGIDFKQDD